MKLPSVPLIAAEEGTAVRVTLEMTAVIFVAVIEAMTDAVTELVLAKAAFH